MYIVSTIESSHTVAPYWINEQNINEIVGIGEAQSREEAYRNALREIKIRIGEEIGVELAMTHFNTKTESDYVVHETSEIEFDVAMEAMLRDVSSHISGNYWEHCRIQTGKKSFNDFFRYYIKADITPAFIDTLRNLTIAENKKRLEKFQQYLDNAHQSLSEQTSLNLAVVLYEYIQALGAAGTLFRGRESNIRRTLNEIYNLLSLLKLEQVTTYSEVRPERHSFEYRVQYDDLPVTNIRVTFRLERGQGRINEISVSDKSGMVRCDLEMNSMLEDNRLAAKIDLQEFIMQLRSLKLPLVTAASYDFQKLVTSRRKSHTFSTMAKEARVRAGSLMISSVRGDYNTIFRRVKNFNCEFYLEELNGRSVSFDKYEAKVECLYSTGIPLLSSKTSNSHRKAEYHFNQPLMLPYEERQVYVLQQMESVAMLINDLKANHEWSIKQISVELTLFGEDDAGNNIAVMTSSGMIPWKNLFEK